MSKRTGAKSRDSIEPLVLERLNSGAEESATLSEVLAIDFGKLLRHVVPDLSADDQQLVSDASGLGITKRMDLMAMVLADHFGDDAAEALMHHSSDTVRGWAAFIIGRNEHLCLNQKLSAIFPLADDPHFCVREWAWLALRPAIAMDINQALTELGTWVRSKSENIRRFAIEATRPRGVWSKHIQILKESPEMARPLLNEVMEDPAKYVQDSCGNWLNDAAKSNPQWVSKFFGHWQEMNSSSATRYIIKRGLRNIA